MARKPRLEVEGGLYHLITRGVDRQNIFHDPRDFLKFLTLLSVQKEKLPFYLYAYCLMTNHIHLLIERRTDNIGRIMHRVLTGYTQYYNRKYHRSGHVLQGRHKAILCQSDPYLAELVRYIHLNPVRAKMVERPEEYPYSSHCAYLGLEPADSVDVDPVLRRFGPKKEIARERYVQFMIAGNGQSSEARFYKAENGVLGTEEFVDSMIHRMGEFATKGTPKSIALDLYPDALILAVEKVLRINRSLICSSGKGAQSVLAKEALVVSGRRVGAGVKTLADLTGMSISTVSRRHDAAISKIRSGHPLANEIAQIIEEYYRESRISQA